ncbi:MAG: Asp-tRNA(Asn)/Glu-tRNA(Gln) amidotransferase subunit GatB [bacterium]|nr:Asp-tRNA(Asn)/Glu-tRNA(Gln) amidotransferase subunit GatB [bacterium]
MNYQPTIGLEIHVELKTKSKMFCSCSNDPDERGPNINVCPVCMGHPGTLPVINKEAVRKVIKTGLALNCHIFERSNFDRKNYFYPDLPKGYQISQFYAPFCKEGFLEVDSKKKRIREIHLEEDTGRLMHLFELFESEDSSESERPDGPQTFVPRTQSRGSRRPEGADYSLVDFNRAGVPLMELVTEPDLNSAKEAKNFAEELRLVLRYLAVSDADMEKGQMRVEVNISLTESRLRDEGGKEDLSSLTNQDKTLGAKVEIKNLNSFRAVEKAIEFEIERQREILESGKKVLLETRGWNNVKSETFSQREKEEAHDYRYFPEPDLPEILISPDFVQNIKADMPELPRQKRERFEREYGLNEKEIEIFVQNKSLGEYFEKIVSEFEPGISVDNLKKLIKLSSNYLITDLQGLLEGGLVSDTGFLIIPENFAELIALIAKEKVSSNIAKIILEEMLRTGADPSHIIEERGLAQITDTSEIEEIVREVILKNPKAIEDYKKGKANALQFLIGQAMQMAKGRANPEVVNRILQKNLTENK